MAFDPPVAMLPALQLLHACSFGAAHLGMMGFWRARVPRELAATAQGFAATWSGMVNASATFASGFVYAASGSLAYLRDGGDGAGRRSSARSTPADVPRRTVR